MKKILTPIIFSTLLLFSFKSPSISAIIEHQNTTSGNSNGSITVNPTGGIAPYSLLIVSVPLAHTKIFTKGDKADATKLKPGKYQIHITDSKNISYSNEVIIE